MSPVDCIFLIIQNTWPCKYDLDLDDDVSEEAKKKILAQRNHGMVARIA